MGTRYSTTPAVAFNSSPPPDDGTQVAANLVQWSMVKTKLADPVHVQADAIDSKLIAALDLSARSISSNDTAVAGDHWKTLQVTGATTIQLSSAASMAAGYEVQVFNAGTGVVTVNPAGSDTINGLSVGVTVSIKGSKVFRTNQALTGYNVVGGFDPQTGTFTTSVVTPLVGTTSAVNTQFQQNSSVIWEMVAGGAFRPVADNTYTAGDATHRIAGVFTPILDSGTTGSGTLKTNNGTTILTWANDLSVKPAGLLDLTTATAGQIGFPASQNASAGVNVLDDYEEGSWTPSVGGTATYTLQEGTYTKIGNMVFIRGSLTINVIGTGSTTVISGFPFTSGNDPSTIFSVRVAGNSVTNIVSSHGIMTNASTTMTIVSRTAASASDSTNAIFQATTAVQFSGSHRV